MSTSRSIAALATSALVVAGLAVGTAHAAPTYEQQVIALTNEQRAANGCGGLAENGALAAAARRHNDEMAAHNHFSHNGVHGEDPGRRIVDAGYPAGRWAENIAVGYPSPREVVTSWMTSPSHRANIVDCGLRDIGVAHAVDGGGRPFWTQDFGAPR